MIEKAQGCLAGLCVGDALGSQVEFMSSEAIELLDEEELSTMSGSSIFNSNTGQITDDGELAMCLVNSLIDNDYIYDSKLTRKYYVEWMNSKPIDIGWTTRNALENNLKNPKSESNGALMRVAPLGIAYKNRNINKIIDAAISDAYITHSNKRVFECNAMFVLAIVLILNNRTMTGNDVITKIRLLSGMVGFDLTWLEGSDTLPLDYFNCMGHVKIAFQNAFYHLRNETPFREAILQTIRRGGDTDTNAAIVGALMGAFWGVGEIPQDWLSAVINCKSYRPLKYKTNNILVLSKNLLTHFG